jgi:ppGpp synthetase/RelA/SpoT-type nucleotidyltranferase
LGELPVPLSKSQINKLGEQLRSELDLDAVLLTQLQEFRSTFDAPMLKAQAAIQEALGIEATARLKTVNTIVEKLRRERTRLAEMQDIAGLRIVQEASITQQDDLVSAVGALFPSARVQDRRSTPSYGYRAVHLIGMADEHRIEIQVRTVLQDGWAQAFEKLADIVGREIRYGGNPARGGDEARSLVRVLQSLSRAIAECESMDPQNRRMRDDVTDLTERIRGLGEHSAPEARKEVESLQAILMQNEERAAAMAASARDLLGAVGELLGGMLRERR